MPCHAMPFSQASSPNRHTTYTRSPSTHLLAFSNCFDSLSFEGAGGGLDSLLQGLPKRKINSGKVGGRGCGGRTKTAQRFPDPGWSEGPMWLCSKHSDTCRRGTDFDGLPIPRLWTESGPCFRSALKGHPERGGGHTLPSSTFRERGWPSFACRVNQKPATSHQVWRKPSTPQLA